MRRSNNLSDSTDGWVDTGVINLSSPFIVALLQIKKNKQSKYPEMKWGVGNNHDAQLGRMRYSGFCYKYELKIKEPTDQKVSKTHTKLQEL